MLLLTGSLAAQDASETTFTVRIENVSGQNTSVYADVGIVGVPVGATQRGAITPGNAYEFTVKAAPGDRLSFATMYGQSNDTFFAPDENGIALFDEMGSPVSGDVSDQVWLWDAGTEVNEPLGTGPNQGGRQESPDAGEPENGTVEVVQPNDEFPASPDLMTVTLTPVDDQRITVRDRESFGDGARADAVLAAGLRRLQRRPERAVLHHRRAGSRVGLGAVAESGNAEILAASVAGSAVMNVGLSPGVFVIFGDDQTAPFFTTGEADRGEGLERQAEEGNPTPLSEALMGFKQVGVFNTAVGATDPGALKPGQAYEFSFTAAPGDRLSFVEMFGQSNDLFFSPDENGIALFSRSGNPIGGTFSGAIQLWDAGTEVNQEPFVGPDQAPRQAAPDTGAAENGDGRADLRGR